MMQYKLILKNYKSFSKESKEYDNYNVKEINVYKKLNLLDLPMLFKLTLQVLVSIAKADEFMIYYMFLIFLLTLGVADSIFSKGYK